MQTAFSEHIGIKHTTFRGKQHNVTVDEINKIYRVFEFDAQTGADPEGGRMAMAAPKTAMLPVANYRARKLSH